MGPPVTGVRENRHVSSHLPQQEVVGAVISASGLSKSGVAEVLVPIAPADDQQAATSSRRQ